MKTVICALICLVGLGFMVQRAGAAAVELNGDTTVIGTLTADLFSGDGSGLTNLNPSSISAGTASINITGNAASAGSILAGGITAPPLAFFQNGAIVAPVGGNYTSPVDAMTDYLSWCPTPSATTPCLLKIMPGVYNVGASSLQMRQYIDIEGSGENVTVIQGNIDSDTAGVVNGSSLAELRSLTVNNTGGGTNAVAIYNLDNSPTLTRLTVNASGALKNYGVFNLASISAASPKMTRLTIRASGGAGSYNFGIYNAETDSLLGSAPTITDVT